MLLLCTVLAVSLLGCGAIVLLILLIKGTDGD